jgi:hypothetical protein
MSKTTSASSFGGSFTGLPFRGVFAAFMAALLLCRFGAAPVDAAPPELPGQIVPIEVEEVFYDETIDQFVAVISLGDETIEEPIDLTIATRDIFDQILNTTQSCPILDLQLGPIFLDLLGLQVETSRIHLEIRAEPNGLLGNLLCAIAEGLLDGDTLGDILAVLTEEEQEFLLGQLQELLNEVLATITSPSEAELIEVTEESVLETAGAHQGRRPPHAGQGGRPGATQILRLEVGPVFLDLLGLVVYLHDCDDGPVIVEIRAQPGEGRLLGNLLASLARLLDRNAALPAIANLLDRISREIDRLVDLQ